MFLSVTTISKPNIFIGTGATSSAARNFDNAYYFIVFSIFFIIEPFNGIYFTATC